MQTLKFSRWISKNSILIRPIAKKVQVAGLELFGNPGFVDILEAEVLGAAEEVTLDPMFMLRLGRNPKSKNRKLKNPLRAGDRIGITVNAIGEGAGMNDDTLNKDYLVELGSIYYYIRDGEVKMIPGRVIGIPIEKKKETNSGIFLFNREESMNDRMIVKYAHEDSELKPGEKVIFHKGNDIIIEIDKEEYFIVDENLILGRYE